MKKNVLKGIAGAALAVSLAACADTFEPGGGKGAGTILPTVGVNSAVVSSQSSRAEAAEVTADMLSLRLTSADGSVSRSWDKLSDFDENEQFNVGKYTLEAYYGDEDTEGFESPYFHGSSELTVRDGEATPVNLTATLANAMVTVLYSPEFCEYMTDWSADVHSAGGKYTYYAKTETRPVYVKEGQVDIAVTFRNPAGNEATIQAATFTAQSRHHYRVTFNVKNGSGDAVLEIIFDDTLTEEVVDIELSDELFNAPAPEITTDGYTDGETFAFVGGTASATPLKANIIARGGLSQVIMSTVSKSLIAQGWPEELDLMNTTESYRQRLASMGFVCHGLYTNPDKMAVIDFTEVLKYIEYLDGGENVSTFSLRAVDKYGKTNETPVTLSVEATSISMSLSNPAPLLIGQSTAAIDLSYNGGNPTGVVAIQYRNDRNTWTNLGVTYSPVSDGVYRASLTGLVADDQDVVLRAAVGSLTSPTITLTRVPGALQAVMSETSAFATYAYVGATPVDDLGDFDLTPVLNITAVKISTDGGSSWTTATSTVEGGKFKVTGLTPGTTYQVRLDVPEVESTASPVAFTTEEALQVSGGAMEDWYSELAPHSQTTGFGMDAYVWYAKSDASAPDYWATRNALTTACEKDPTPYYVSYSGTQSATGASGKAAEISTLGYGKGSTYIPSGGICKYKAAGMLFMGTHSAASETEETIEYGRPFTSRPTSFSFNYKFASYNGESFKAYIVVEHRGADASVVELGRGELVSSTDQGSFVPATVNVTYTRTDLKATHMYIVFISSTADSPAVQNVTGSKGAFGGYADSRRIGNVLTVDDIVINY